MNVESAEKAAKLVSERFPNVKAIAWKADVSKESEVEAAVKKAVEEFGRLDVMVCCIVSPSVAVDYRNDA